MKFVVLAALVAAVACTRLRDDSIQHSQRPWQAGKLYRYEVESYNLAHLPEGASSGNAFRARFIVRVKAPGKLQAKLENPQHAVVHHQLTRDRELPSDLKYDAVDGLDQHIDINVEGGRVLNLRAPFSLSLSHENLLKGFLSALQVDLSIHRNDRNPQNTYDEATNQGQFRKMETDVTGDCVTLYTVSPVASEWRRELPNFSLKEDPIEITKSKNYEHCHRRVAYHFGVPDVAEWTGTAQEHKEQQFISHSTTSRILAAKQGPIYKAETTSSVHVHPHFYGKQKAEVLSHVKLTLTSHEDDKEPEWQKYQDSRQIDNLLFAMTTKGIAPHSGSLQSQEQEGIEVDSPQSRVRRSFEKKFMSFNKVITVKRSDRSKQTENSWEDLSDSHSSEEDDVTRPVNDPSYINLFMDPQPDTDKKDNPTNAQKLVQEIAQLLQNPNNMPKADFLSKFNILVHLISSMSFAQLSQTSRSIEGAKTSNNIAKTDMWMIYRDAVAQCGNLPAFKQIRSWIQNKNIQGEEAAEVVATLVHTLRYPTKEVMTEFFKLAMSPEVQQQKYLNTTALIAATKFINMGQVNNDTARNRFPTHIYGRLADKYDNFVREDILRPLRSELEKAIQVKDSNKAQVYIKSIGNLGHHDVMEVFAPYLEGHIPVSTYLRAHMVDNLRILALQRDSYARNVFYSIMRNTAEPYEVRLAAIRNMFVAQPTSGMMAAMAQMTHDDPSVRVRATLKTSIECAARLQNPRFFELARKAQAVRDSVTQEELPEQSYVNVDYYDNQNELNVISTLTSSESEDSVLPKYLKYSVNSRPSGWNEVGASASSVQQFLELFQQQMASMWQQKERSEPNHKYSAKKISEMLNLKHSTEEPLAGDFNINIMNQQRYFTFNENDLKKLPIMIRDLLKNLQQGIEKHYTKVLNQEQVLVMFPMSTGMPFIYKYKEPTVVHIQGKLKGNVNLKSDEYRKNSASIEKEIEFTFARNLDGSVGFYDTLTNQHASTGVVNKMQLYIPVKLNVQMEAGEVKIHLAPLRPDQDTTLVHYSVWPYTAHQKRESLVPVSLDQSTKPITRNNKVHSIDFKFGQTTGHQFQCQGYTYSTDAIDIRKMIKSRDPVSNIALVLAQTDIAQTHYNFRYLGKQSTGKGVAITAVYDEYYNQKQGKQSPLAASKVQDVTPNSAGRREEMMKRVSSGIDTAKARVVDLSATFEGPKRTEYVMTAAITESHVDPKIQSALFAGINSEKQGNSQINVVGTVQQPGVTTLNLEDALQKELKTNFDFEIKFYGNDENGNVNINGYAERTKKYADELKKHPLVQKAMQEIAKNNYYQEASHKMLVMAHAPDYVKASINYNNISPALKYIVFQAYSIAESFNHGYHNVNPLKILPEGKIELEMKNAYLDNQLNMFLKSRYGEVQVKNAPIPKSLGSLLSSYYPFTPKERIYNYYLRHQYQPFCTVDGNRIRTFSERSYKYTLSPSWHVVMHDAPKHQNQNEQLVMLARKLNEKQQEIYISYQSRTGSNLEIEIHPAPEGSNKHKVDVKTNAKKVSDGELTMYWDSEDTIPFLEYYTQPDGVLMLHIRENHLRVMYDGERVVVLARNNRNRTQGICGLMTGEPRNDYMTPHGLVDQPEYFGATFALNDQYSDSKTQQLQEQAKQTAYQRQYKYTNILRSDKNWQQAMEDSSSSEEDWGNQRVYRTKAYSKDQGPCELKQQVQYYQNHGEICITTAPLLACQSHCKGQGYSEYSAQVVCRSKLDQEFQQYRNQIQQGQNPIVEGVPMNRIYKVPNSCQA